MAGKQRSDKNYTVRKKQYKYRVEVCLKAGRDRRFQISRSETYLGVVVNYGLRPHFPFARDGKLAKY